MIPQAANECWYYAQNQKKLGPVSLAQLRTLRAEGGLQPEVMVFQEGTLKWRPLAEVAGAAARPALLGSLRKLVLAGSIGLVLLAVLGWGLVVTLHGPASDEGVENPEQVAALASGAGVAKGANEEAEKASAAEGEQQPPLPQPQKRDDAEAKIKPPASSPPGPKPKETPAAPPVPLDRPDPTPTHGMTQALDVDLRADPRKDFQVDGPVEFTAGRLAFGPGGSMRRVLDAGSQAKLTLKLAFTPLSADGQSSTTRLAFQIRDRGEFVVEIVRRREGGKQAGEVRLVDRDAGDVKGKQTRTLQTSPWQGEFPDSPWTFRHHHGLVTVYCGDKKMVVGYADKATVRDGSRVSSSARDAAFFHTCGISEPLEVAGWSLEQQGMPVACLAVSGSASPSYRTGLPPPWQKALANTQFGTYRREANDLRARLDHRIRHEGNATDHDSIQSDFAPWERGEPDFKWLTDRSLTGVVGMLGKKHHYYALAVAGVGMQFFWVGNKNDVAERLLKQAAEISEEALGIWHPDCALVVANLARVYVKTGKLELAEPLLKKVSEAAAAAFGTDSFRYAATLRELAMLQQYRGRLAEAETMLRQAVAACKEAPLPQRADALIALGELEAVMGEGEKAAAALKRAEETIAAEMQRLRGQPPRAYMPLFVPLARANVRRAWILFHAGQKEQARQLGRAAFLGLAQFWNSSGSGPGRFEGWNHEIVNATPNSFLGGHPAYAHVMLDIAELFIALGDVVPATGAVRILDQVPGQTHHERGAIYRLMSNICAANPKVNIGIRPGFSERMRLDAVYDAGKGDRVVYWQKLAQAEFEKFAGREHADTIGMLLDQARRQWRVSGPKAAEPTLYDAFSRAMLLSDRVLAGLPEAQAYQFGEANPPPTDMLLSSYRATKQESGRDAYEVVWRAKALATRQFAERRQLLQAAAGKPELVKIAKELQTTRQQLAQLSLSNPPEAALERRQQELAKLTQRKEDLERELAQLSEPFRRTRDAGRTSVADMVRLLPAKTAVVDFVERWQWTPRGQSQPVGLLGQGKKDQGVLPVGSIWRGEKHRNEANRTMPAMLKITERDGDNFKGEFTFDRNNVNAVAGTIANGKIAWQTTKILRGNVNQPTTGTLKENSIDAKFNLVTRSGKKTYAATGTIKLSFEGYAGTQLPSKEDNAGAAQQPGKEILKIEGKLAKDDPFDKKFAKCHRQQHNVKLNAGQKVWIDLKSQAFDCYLRIEDSAGNVLDENDDTGDPGDLNSRIFFATPKTGIYTLVVTSYAGDTRRGKIGPFLLIVKDATEDKAPGAWVRTRIYDAFVLRAAAGQPGWSAAWVTLGEADSLDRLLDDWIAGLRRGGPSEVRFGEPLRQRMWAPIEAALGDCKTAILIPDGRLAQIPWAALPGKAPNSYLLEDFDLAQASYGQQVARILSDAPADGKGFLLVGGVDFGPAGKWSYLKGTAAEAEHLAKLRPGAETLRLSGKTATKSRLAEALPGRRYVHLATHGDYLAPGPGTGRARVRATDSFGGGALFDVSARNPFLLSMLVLAGANEPAQIDDRGLPVGGDGYLTAEEVMGLDLTQTELVVLSACQTGTGKIRNGEGVFSLQRAFHVGGSRTVAATLWSIPDQPTQVLMERFYTNMWQRKMGKLAALIEAQKWMLREGRSHPGVQRGLDLENVPMPAQKDGRLPPFYWAAFVLSGDWR
jgi:CHAT domain-containing protein/tetratricopeptide (TPR) repeat protein